MGREKATHIYTEFSDFGFVALRVRKDDVSRTIEDLKFAGPRDDESLKSALESLDEVKRSGYILSHIGFYPSSRVFLRTSLDDPKRGKDGEYLGTLVKNEAKIEPDTYALSVLHPSKGIPIDFAETPEKEVLFCGGQQEDFAAFQEKVLRMGLFPLSLEIGTLATIGGLIDYLDYAAVEEATLVLEMGMDSSQAFILHEGQVAGTRKIAQGLQGMVKIVQRELGLKDEKAALRLFYSDTFDFQEMGPQLVGDLLQEVNAYTAYFELETGHTVGQILCTLIPNKLGWLNRTLSKLMVVDPLDLDYSGWLQSHQIEFDSSLFNDPPTNLLGLIGLMIERREPSLANATTEEES